MYEFPFQCNIQQEKQMKAYTCYGNERWYRLCFYDVNNLLMPVFCSEVSLAGNLMLNLILKLPFLEGSLGMGIPSPLTTSS